MTFVTGKMLASRFIVTFLPHATTHGDAGG
jgi:hypothetical protein